MGEFDTDGAAWGDWFRDVAGSVIGKASDAAYVRPYDIQAMRLEALGDMGYYAEGQRGTMSQTGGGITPGMMLLIGGAILAVVMLKD